MGSIMGNNKNVKYNLERFKNHWAQIVIICFSM